MKTVRFVAWILPLTVVALGCERQQPGPDRVVDPVPSVSAPEVLEGHWVWDKSLDDALQSAASSPLVRQVVAASPVPGAKPVWSKAVRAEGRVTGDREVGFTILPYSVNDDPTHAFFVSLYEHEGMEIAEPSELIVGRKPTSAETGFGPVSQGSETFYVKTGVPYAIGASGVYQLSPQRRNWTKFFTCFAERAPQYCASFGSVGRETAPNYPYSFAIGCGVGVAVAGLECLFGSR